MLAHALRTLPTALQLQADVLDGGKDAGEKAACLAELRTGIRRVIRLSEQRFRSRAMNTQCRADHREKTDLRRSFDDVTQFYGAAARAAEVEILLESDRLGSRAGECAPYRPDPRESVGQRDSPFTPGRMGARALRRCRRTSPG